MSDIIWTPRTMIVPAAVVTQARAMAEAASGPAGARLGLKLVQEDAE